MICYQSRWYPSVENAYQAAKMENLSDRIRFVDIKASEAKKLGRVLPMRANWDQVKLEVMYDLLVLKFAHEPLRNFLLNTGEEELQEGNWWGDFYWGTVNGVGENHLGKLLMRVREEIKNETT